ncbi:MAG: AbrB/MazE/SpoVT family DNA-binding domain-containing protein [Gammaproteobacteria bacterium]|nr:AbrB/MazE/SpoVT family DNA-binding domain-containing protein [Gammaproteobacteria bacterium]
MLAKMTSKNQVTLPKALVKELPGVNYFEVSKEGDRIILKPLRKSRVEEVWDKLEKLGITEKDVEDAVRWARERA